MNLKYCIFADSIIREANGKCTIIGIFSGIASNEFPCVHPKFSIAILIEGNSSEAGLHQLELSFVDADYRPIGDPHKVSFSLNKENMPDGIPIAADITVNVANLQIPKAGLYELTVKVDNRHIGSTVLSVHLLEQSTP